MTWVPLPDVSEHQGHIDAVQMAGAGISDCIVRGHSGGRKDLRVDEYVPTLRGAGIGVPMLYGFCNPKSAMTAKSQGLALAELCRRYNVHTAMADCEWYTNEPGSNPVLVGAAYFAWLVVYIDAIEQQMQAPAAIYTSKTFWDGTMGGSDLFAGHDVILARYPGLNRAGDYDPLPRGVEPARWADVAFHAAIDGPALPAGFASWAGWQFSAGGNGQGPVYGCSSGNLDLNIVDRDALARWYGAGRHEPGVITNQEDEVTDDDRQKIIDGVVAALAGPDVDNSPLGPMVTKKTFDVVYGLWRSPEILTALIDPQAKLDEVTRAAGNNEPPAA